MPYCNNYLIVITKCLDLQKVTETINLLYN